MSNLKQITAHKFYVKKKKCVPYADNMIVDSKDFDFSRILYEPDHDYTINTNGTFLEQLTSSPDNYYIVSNHKD